MDVLFLCCFKPRSRLFRYHVHVTIVGKVLQNLSPFAVFSNMETCFLWLIRRGVPIKLSYTTNKGDWRIYFNPGSPRDLCIKEAFYCKISKCLNSNVLFQKANLRCLGIKKINDATFFLLRVYIDIHLPTSYYLRKRLI